MRERSLLGMLVLAFALGRATLSPTKRDPFHKKRRWSALLYLLLKWLCVVFSLRAVLRDPSLTVWKSNFNGRVIALVDVHTGPSTGRASKLMQNRRCPV